MTEAPSIDPGQRTRDLHKDVLNDVRDRQRWMERQAVWYAMRHDGLRRRNKPWPHAADMHFPLADSIIRKQTPFYFNQLFATEVIAQFATADPEVAAFASEMGQWFDFKLKQQSNLEREVLIGIDKMQMSGQVTLKVLWNAYDNRLEFDAIEPTHCIVPDGTTDLQKADHVTLVHHLSPDAYRRDPRFTRKDEAFIKRITGKRGEGESGDRLTQDKQLREGITHASSSADCIIVWEMWELTAEEIKDEAGKVTGTKPVWWVHWICPAAPSEPLRASQKNPFLHGKLPIVRFDCELKDKGHYQSRGIPETVGAFERSLCSTWNQKLDAMTLFNTPTFTSENPIPNAGNVRMIPGMLSPAGVKPMTSANRPPYSFDEEMQMTRGIAENLAGTPDYGIGENDNTSQPRTLGEVERIQQQSGIGIDLKARIFRMALRELLQLAWETLLQYDQSSQYFVAGEVRKLPPAALQSGAWMVHPNGSSESWNKPQMLQRAVARFQMFGPSQAQPQGDPFINQGELRKTVLELDDPRLVARLWQDPNAQMQSEYDDEGKTIPALLLGQPLQSQPQNDQAIRIKALSDFMDTHLHIGRQIDELGKIGIANRIKSHLMLLQQKNPEQAAKVGQLLQAKAAQHAGNVVAMPQKDSRAQFIDHVNSMESLSQP